jgi:hypothetical protein
MASTTSNLTQINLQDISSPSRLKRSVTERSPHVGGHPNSETSDSRNANKDSVPISNWSRFIVIESLDSEKNLSTLSPFVIEKTIQGLVGTVKGARKLRSGALLIETLREAQTTNLLKLDTFASLKVKVSTHRSMNTCKGVIRSVDLSQMSEVDLLAELQSQGVTGVKFILQTRSGHRQKSPTIILTFGSSTLPPAIRAGYLRIKVSAYIPNPLRCFKCQKYGHHNSTCKHQSMCAKCGLPDHGEEPCSRPPQCLNCNGDHPAFFTTCPIWLREKEICKIKTQNDIPYPEARKRVLATNQTPIAGISYATAATGKPVMRSVETQTEVTHCKCIATISASPKHRNIPTQTQTEEEQMQNDAPSELIYGQASVTTLKSKQKRPNNSAITNSQNSSIQSHTAPNAEQSTGVSAKPGKPNSPVAAAEQHDQNTHKKLKFHAQSSSPSKEHRPRSSKGPGGKQPERAPKGTKNAIQNFNKFASLADYEDYEMEGVMSAEHDPGGSKPPRKPIEAPR